MDVAQELKWLKANPAFEERPATVSEFLGSDYLNIERGVRKTIRSTLQDIMGDDIDGRRMTKFSLAMITGGIGIGKTTIASIVLPWMTHWVLCLRNPQDYFDLLPGSRIAFMQMSTSEDQAKEVLFGDIKARILHSPWFRDKYPFDPNFKNQIRFPKDIWIIPGDSSETTFEGYNILGGILDEADSHKVTKDKDYAEDGFNTIHARVTSRFQDRGFVLVIGQMKKSTGFAARKYQEMKNDPKAYVARMSIWESLGWDRFLKPDGTRDSFWYDTKRKQIVPDGIGDLIGADRDHLIEIPTVYRRDFENKPEKALKDLAGIPPAVGDPFISLVHKIEACRDRWKERYPTVGSPARPDRVLERWFRAPDTRPRAIHIDMAYSGDGDALGLAMGHVDAVVEIDNERKPYIVFDLLYRWKVPAGQEIFLGDVRRFIYALRDDLGFKIGDVTMDGFESTDTKQQMARRRFNTEYVSVDKTTLPYHDLREAIYEDRLEFPPYMVQYNMGDDHLIEIAVKELMELVDEGKKIDHPVGGSKDVTDAMAGVTYTLMGDRKYSRKVVSINTQSNAGQATGTHGRMTHPALGAMNDVGALTGLVSAPVPPGAAIDRLRPRGR